MVGVSPSAEKKKLCNDMVQTITYTVTVKKKKKKKGCPAIWTGKSPVTETSESAQYLTY